MPEVRLPDLVQPPPAVAGTAAQAERGLAAALRDGRGVSVDEFVDGDHRGFLRAMLESLDTPVAAVDAAGRLTAINQAMRELHRVTAGMPDEQFWSAVTAQLRRPDGTALPREEIPLLRALHGEHVRDIEVLVDVPGDPVRTVLVNAQPILAGGRQLGAVVACHDVTERRRAERFRECHLAIATELAHTGDLQAAAPEVTRAVAAALGWPYVDLRVRDGLVGALRLAGRYSEVIASHDGFTVPPAALSARIGDAAWAAAQPRWESDPAGTAHPGGDGKGTGGYPHTGSGAWVGFAVPIPDGDRPLGVLTCLTDRPERDRAELTMLLTGVADQLGQFLASARGSQLSTEVRRCRDDLLSLLGHEVRTPLTAISSYIDMLLSDPDPPSHAGDTRQLHEGIARNAGALRAIIDDLLDLATLESGYQQILIRPIDLAEIVRQALDDVQGAAEANDVTIVAILPEEHRTAGDPQRLRQALNNVLSNAVKYNNDGGQVRLTLTADDHHTMITVADTGIGVPAEEHGRLFNRFYRASNARHSVVGGTGLGLSLVYTIIDAHGGSITIDSATAVGTILAIRLPRNPGGG